MRESLFVLLIAATLSALLWRLLRSRQQMSEEVRRLLERNQANFLPLHCRYFAQVRQALAVPDERYLRGRVALPIVKRALRERRQVAIKFLAGLHEDFSNLERLGRAIAVLSPAIDRQQEMERLVLGLRFRVLYAWVWLRLSTGNVPLPAIENLTGLVGRLATQMQQAMLAIDVMSAGRLDTNVNA